MTMKHNRTVRLAGQGHVFIWFSALGGADRTLNSSGFVKGKAFDELGGHLIEPSELRLYDRFIDAGFARRLLLTVAPPLLRGVL